MDLIDKCAMVLHLRKAENQETKTHMQASVDTRFRWRKVTKNRHDTHSLWTVRHAVGHKQQIESKRQSTNGQYVVFLGESGAIPGLCSLTNRWSAAIGLHSYRGGGKFLAVANLFN